VNVFGNWVFIYGNLGMPAYGLDGAGYSTLITRGFMAGTMMFYVLYAPRFQEFEPTLKFRNINWPVIKRLIQVGIPTGLQHFFEVGAFSFSAVMIGWLGSKQLAAHQVALSLAAISFMIILGIAAAGTIRVGHAFGKENHTDVRRAGFLTTIFAATVMAIFGICFILFKNILPLVFITDPEVVAIAASLLVVAAFFQISDGAQAAGLGILRGITDVKIPMIITFIAYWVIALPIGYLLGFTYKLDAIGIWIGLLTGLSVAAILLNIRFGLKTKNLNFRE
jgi:MATE family multidrug resistance protein